MNRTTHQKLARRKRRVLDRLARVARHKSCRPVPVLAAGNIHFETGGRTRAVACGGIGAVHLLAARVGLAEAIDRDLHLLQQHKPYHESDHVLAVAYNVIAGGTCLQDLELLRNDEAFLDALGADAVPDPTTAGDFCRRFAAGDVDALTGAINRVRVRVWRQQPPEFFRRAVVDADGTLVATTGECKEGADFAYDGTYGYHVLVVSLANTREPLFLVNRPGNRPSHEGAARKLDEAIELCLGAGFERVLLRGDTDFSQSEHLDRWDARGGVTFLFGIDSTFPRQVRAEMLPASAWQELRRPPRHEVKTEPRAKPQRVKERVVRERHYKNVVAVREDVAEFDYRPAACGKAYRVLVLRKLLGVEAGQNRLWEEYRYFFFITNDRTATPAALVLEANGRCDQPKALSEVEGENLIEQLKNGARAMKMPSTDLESNGAYMVMASLAWTLKAWAGLLLPVSAGPHRGRHEQLKRRVVRMEFKGFVNALVRVPCQVVRSGRRLVYRLLNWSPWSGVLLRAAEAWRGSLPPARPLRC